MSKQKYLLPFALLLVLIFIFYGFMIGVFLKNALCFTSRGKTLQQNFQSKQEMYLPLVTTILDKAQTTNVRKDIDDKYNLLLSDSNGRKPVYFIRLKDGKLQKLFQSGEIKYEDIDTLGERRVAEMLEGKINPISFPQYTCCGPDDIWTEIFPLNLLLPDRRYLKDFPSELETILLIRDQEGNIKGAMVDLHGD